MLVRFIGSIVLASSATLMGCLAAPPPFHPSSVTVSPPTPSVDDEVEPLESFTDVQVIWRWAHAPTPAIENEINRRKLFTDLDWKFVRGKTVNLGMSGFGVMAVRGVPEDIATTTNALGTTKVYTYSSGPDRSLIYFENNRVVQITNW